MICYFSFQLNEDVLLNGYDENCILECYRSRGLALLVIDFSTLNIIVVIDWSIRLSSISSSEVCLRCWQSYDIFPIFFKYYFWLFVVVNNVYTFLLILVNFIFVVVQTRIVYKQFVLLGGCLGIYQWIVRSDPRWWFYWILSLHTFCLRLSR